MSNFWIAQTCFSKFSQQLVQIYDIYQTYKPNISYSNKFIDLLLLSINDWDTQLCSDLMDNV